MGGVFSPTQSPTTIVGATEPALQPFQAELVKAIAGLFGSIPGISPLEQATVQGAFQQAEPVRNLLDMTVQGGFLPGQAHANPFTSALLGAIDAQGDVARRQLGAAAQKAGALSSDDFLRHSTTLETALQQKKNELLADLFERERSRQFDAIPLLSSLASQLLGFAGYPRQQATQAQLTPFNLGLSLLGTGSSSVIPGQTGPSPFASLLQGLAGVVPLIKF